MYNLIKLTEQDVTLYEDMCHGNGIIPRLSSITNAQIHFLVSLRENGVAPEFSPTGGRWWKIPGKRAQGGKLTQKTAQKFFLSEK